MSDTMPHELRSYPIYGRLQDRAPGFTLEALDRLLKDAWAAGFYAGATDVQPELDAAHRRTAEVEAAVQRVVGGQLIHIARKLHEGPRSKTTIAAERRYMGEQGAALEKAVRDLGIGGRV